MDTDSLLTRVEQSLADMKAVDTRVIDVRAATTVTDYMIVTSGNSSRHVKAIADDLVRKMKESGHPPLGLEGDDRGEWILVDLADIVVHVMRPQVREFYNLEKLWSLDTAGEPSTSPSP